jgi:hypothetical protein
MGMVHSIFKAVIVTASLLISLVAQAAPPDWIVSNAKMYPVEMYLVGRGAGSTEEEAQNRARGDLATIFEVRVQVLTENTTMVAKSGSKEQVDSQALQQVSAKTDKVISSINIAEIWRDPETKEFHALAVLSRSQAAASLREEIGNLDDGVQRDVNAAKEAGDPLLKIAVLARAMESAIKRDGFQTSLKVIDTSGRGIEAPIPQMEVLAQIDDVLLRIKIAPEVAPDDAEHAGAREFSTILKGGLAAAGFLAQGSDKADFVLVGKLTLNDMDQQNNWYWVRGTVEVSLVEKNSGAEKASGRVRGSKTWPIKASARDARTARSRVLIEVEKLLRQELRSAIIGFASGS